MESGFAEGRVHNTKKPNTDAEQKIYNTNILFSPHIYPGFESAAHSLRWYNSR